MIEPRLHAFGGLDVAGQKNAFDFLAGAWSVKHRKLKFRLVNCQDWVEFPGTLEVRPILAGNGNIDHNFLDDPTGAFVASSLRLYDRGLDRWSIYWIDGRSPALDSPVVGRFKGPLGSFYSHETLRGKPIEVRTTYESISVARAEWTQAFSADFGQSWEINWVMSFSRASQ